MAFEHIINVYKNGIKIRFKYKNKYVSNHKFIKLLKDYRFIKYISDLFIDIGKLLEGYSLKCCKFGNERYNRNYIFECILKKHINSYTHQNYFKFIDKFHNNIFVFNNHDKDSIVICPIPTNQNYMDMKSFFDNSKYIEKYLLFNNINRILKNLELFIKDDNYTLCSHDCIPYFHLKICFTKKLYSRI